MPKYLEVLIIAAGVFLAWKIYQSRQAQVVGHWQEFPGGVGIDPNGNYFVNGKLVWSPSADYANA